jgi:predicted dehydrogenase
MKTLSVGIVGAGEIARNIHLPVLANLAGARVAWLYDIDPLRADSMAYSYGVPSAAGRTPEQLCDCDVVMLAIPATARMSYLQTFSRSGVAVLCEKPFAASAAEHQQFVDLFPDHALGVSFQRRYMHYTLTMRKLLAANLFGPLRAIHVHQGARTRRSGSEQSFLNDPRYGAISGVLYDLGSHAVDLAFHLTGAPGFELYRAEAVLDGAVDRKFSVQATLKDSKVGGSIDLALTGSWLDSQSNALRLEFEHAVLWSPLGPGDAVYLGRSGEDVPTARLESRLGAHTQNQASYLLWQAFLDGVRHGNASEVAAHSIAPVSAFLEQAMHLGKASHD